MAVGISKPAKRRYKKKNALIRNDYHETKASIQNRLDKLFGKEVTLEHPYRKYAI